MAKNIYNRIMRMLFEKPSYKFHLRELARMARGHPNTARAAAQLLEKEGIARIEKRKHLTEISADIESKAFVRKKRAFNFEQIYGSGVIEYLAKRFDPESISVMGSYSRGEDIEKSDIDVVVIKPLAKEKNEKGEDIGTFESVLKRRIHLIVADYREMSDEFYTNLINGMLLYGYLRKK